MTPWAVARTAAVGLAVGHVAAAVAGSAPLDALRVMGSATAVGALAAGAALHLQHVVQAQQRDALLAAGDVAAAAALPPAPAPAAARRAVAATALDVAAEACMAAVLAPAAGALALGLPLHGALNAPAVRHASTHFSRELLVIGVGGALSASLCNALIRLPPLPDVRARARTAAINGAVGRIVVSSGGALYHWARGMPVF